MVNHDCLMGDVAVEEGLGATAPWGDAEAVGAALLGMKDTVVELSASGEREHQRWLAAMKPVLENFSRTVAEQQRPSRISSGWRQP